MRYLSRAESAQFLAEQRGFPVAKNTLQKYATVGGGPPYRKFGGRVLYTEADLLEWAEGRMQAPRRSTSDQ